jgi:uncharacterized protein (TIRG00374 family)
MPVADVEADGLIGEVDRSQRPAHPVRRAVVRTLKIVAVVVVVYFIFLNIPGLRNAVDQLQDVYAPLLVLGLALELAALFAYSLMTKAALGEGGAHLSNWRVFRIQMSTKALSSIVPGGSAAGSALGYRLFTLSGVPGPDAGFALATAGLGSAVVLNLIFFLGLVVSIPVRGVNPTYTTAAIVGVIVMVVAAFIVFGLMEGQGRAERAVRWIARKLRQDDVRMGQAVRHLSSRMEDMLSDRKQLGRVVGWATANWLLDAAALWVFLRAFGGSVAVDGLLVAFGLANIVAVVPITPGGLGLVEGVYVPTLVGFGLNRASATIGVLSYRVAQLWFPIVLGGILYLSLRFGPWSIERRERLPSMAVMVGEDETKRLSKIDFVEGLPPMPPRRPQHPPSKSPRDGL